MAPVVIADSDDEDDSSYSPPPKTPAPIARPDLDATRSHEAVDHSSSTDSAFFRSVLDEQNEAARNCARVTKTERTPKSGLVSFGAPPMSTDPLQGEEVNVLDMDVEQERGRDEDTNDPWEIPSSPADRPNPATVVKKPAERGRKKTTKGRQKQPFAHSSYDVSLPGYGEEGRRTSKRRKVEPSQDSDSVDLVMLPSTQEVDADPDTPSTMPPPTLPVEKTPRVVGNLLTNSQKKEYQSFPATGGTEMSQDQGPTRPEDATPFIRSSSSGTNINTPRSEPIPSRNIDTIPEEQYTPMKEDAKILAGHWDSSPEVISAADPNPTAPRAVKRKQGAKRESARSHEVANDEDDISYEHQDPREDYDDNDEESDFVEKPVVRKQTKQRGRPKKNLDATSAAGPTNSTTSHAAEGRSVTKTKKKRGRPKKAEKLAVEEAKDAQVDTDTRVDTDLKEVAKTEEETAHGQDVIANDNSAESALKSQEEAASKALESRKEQAAETSGRKTPRDESEQAGQAMSSKPTSKPVIPAASLSASKPLYRVGLSKKSRIAPLLKIRK